MEEQEQHGETCPGCEEKQQGEREKPEGEEEKLSRKDRKLQEKLEKAESDAHHWKNEYYKAYADTENLRKTLENEQREAIKYRAAGFLEQLVPALDAFYAALSNPAPTKEAENYKVGFEYIYRQIVGALEGEGLKEIEPAVGDPFDSRFMHALDTEESDDPGKVSKVHAKGYMLKDRMIRPVMVTATVKKAEEKKEESSPLTNEKANMA